MHVSGITAYMLHYVSATLAESTWLKKEVSKIVDIMLHVIKIFLAFLKMFYTSNFYYNKKLANRIS